MKSVEIQNNIIILEEKLRNLMISGDMTVNEFSRKADLNPQWTYAWKSGKRRASYEQIIKIGRKLEI